MWNELAIKNVGRIRKVAGEFEVWMQPLLPYGKMKVKIYEHADGTYTGYTDIQLKRKFDGSPEGGVGFGESIEEALEETITCFNNMVEEDNSESVFLEGISEKDIEYIEYSDF